MAQITISEASRLTGKARSTLHRHIQQGKLSKEKDAQGNPVVDIAELERVYGPLSHGNMKQTEAMRQPATPENDSQNNMLQLELKLVRERLAEKDETIEDLRRRLDQSEEERRRLTLMLTDQRGGIWQRIFKTS